MPFSEWLVIILYLGLVGLFLNNHHRKKRHIIKLQKAVHKFKLKIYELEEKYRQKEIRHKKTEVKLRGYLQLLDTLINTIPNPIYFKDDQGVFQGCNEVFANQLLGLKRDRIIGNRAQDMSQHIPQDLAALYQSHEREMMGKRKFHTFEARVRCADEVHRDFLFSLAPIKNPKGKIIGIVAVLSDLTEKNKAVRDCLIKEKLKSALETAGGVCHEFNQPLQALSGNLEILSVKLDTSSEALYHIEKAVAQIERMRNITDKLQGITRYETIPYIGNNNIIDISKCSNKLN